MSAAARTSPLALLRSPDFPWVRAETARVSFPAQTGGGGLPSVQVERLARQMRDARVGGRFWARSPERPTPAALLCPTSLGQAERMIAHARARAPSDAIHVLARDAGLARALASSAATADSALIVGDVDPWGLMDPETLIYAPLDHELALLASVVGARVVPPTDEWRAQSAESLRPRLGQALAMFSYRDPFSGAAVGPERAIEVLAEWRRVIDANRDLAVVVGVRWWKRRTIDRFLWAGDAGPPPVARSRRAALAAARRLRGRIALWPSRAPAGLEGQARDEGIGLAKLEDGFIRSAGLGVELFPPLSIIVDPIGIHYDPHGPSALERMLEGADFTPAILERAAALIAAIRRARVSKYGGGERAGAVSPFASTRRRVLVAGQVEDDESVRLGGAAVAGNLDLLRRARAAEPNAEIWYRPHPDVEAGHRGGAIARPEALRYADQLEPGEAIASLLDRVDGVHVLTSLTGFEALLRGRDVTTHGHPFYAGWGLTMDLAPPLARRTRRRSLEELVAAALILYPRYLDPVTGLPCAPEILVDRLGRSRGAARATLLNRIRRWQGRARGALRSVKA